MNIFVANLNFETTSEDLQDLFEEFGAVSTAKVINDRETGRSRGFGFVEMDDESQGNEAIASLNESSFAGNTIVVKKARPKTDNRGGGGGYGGGRPRNNYNNRY